MKKVSKKMVGEFLAETKAELNWCVFSFDKNTGVRDMAYGGYEFMSAFAVMTNELAKGNDVILTNKEGWDFSNKYEWANKKRVTYDQMKEYQVVIGQYTFEISKVRKY